MFYHVRLTQHSNRSHDEVKLDLTEEQLRERFVEPYERGEPIIVNGKTIPPGDIERILIGRSKESSASLIARVRYEDMNSSVVVIGGSSYEWRAANLADDITDDIIKGPPGYRPIAPKLEAPRPEAARMNKGRKKVFVVHGHDHNLKNDLEVFLTENNLDAVVLHRQPDEGLT